MMKFIALLIPIPLFYDLGLFEFFISTKPFEYKPTIPVNIGFFSVAIIFFLSLLNKNNKKFFLNLTPIIWFFLTITIVYAFYTIGYVRGFQILIPLIFLLGFFLGKNWSNYYENIASYMIVSMAFFSIFHIISLVMSSDSFQFNKSEFVSFYGVEIYQGLVSYPGVLSLYFSAIMILILRAKSIRLPMLVIASCLFYFLVMSSGRKAAFLSVNVSLLVTLLFVLFDNRNLVYFHKKTLTIMGLLLVSLFGYLNYNNSLVHKRIEVQRDQGTIYSTRLDKWSQGIDFVSKSNKDFIFGSSERERPGFHNYFLDTVARLGILGLSLLLLSLIFILRRLFRFLYYQQFKIDWKSFVIFFVPLSIESMINSPLTQPYYISNFLFLFLGLSIVRYFHEGNFIYTRKLVRIS